ncbi:hypothetical protein D3C72_2463660 [compost metagenome]
MIAADAGFLGSDRALRRSVNRRVDFRVIFTLSADILLIINAPPLKPLQYADLDFFLIFTMSLTMQSSKAY